MEEIPLPHEILFLVCTNRREDGRPACGPSGGDSLHGGLKRLVRERQSAVPSKGGVPPKGACPPTGASPPAGARPSTEAHPPTGAPRARVSSTGCLGCCADGPTVVVFPGGVRYARVREDDLPEILERHLPGEA